MTEMMIRCPDSHALLDTGRDMKPELFRVSEVEGGVVDCPDCATTHAWSKRDVIFTS